MSTTRTELPIVKQPIRTSSSGGWMAIPLSDKVALQRLLPRLQNEAEMPLINGQIFAKDARQGGRSIWKNEKTQRIGPLPTADLGFDPMARQDIMRCRSIFVPEISPHRLRRHLPFWASGINTPSSGMIVQNLGRACLYGVWRTQI
jgi:hypothetical protein